MLEAARHYTDILELLTALPAYDHDLGFQVFKEGNGYRLTEMKIQANHSERSRHAGTLFNPKVYDPFMPREGNRTTHTTRLLISVKPRNVRPGAANGEQRII